MFPLKDNIPTRDLPVVTIALIAINVLVYFLWQKGGLSLGDPSGGHYRRQLLDYALRPCELDGRCAASGPAEALTPFTAMFMHGGLLHLGGNMLFLWIFGNNVEDAMGRGRFVVFYLVGGLAADALQIATDLGTNVPTIGASGAVAAVLGGYLLLYPRAKVVTLVFIIFLFTILELPALLFLVIWFGQQLLFGAAGLTSGGDGGGVAYFAHIGGFAFGLLTIKLFATRRNAMADQRRVPVA